MDHDFEEAAAEFAKFIASHGMTLIFGGSNVGTMKTVADAALSAGGRRVHDEPSDVARSSGAYGACRNPFACGAQEGDDRTRRCACGASRRAWNA